MNRIYKVKKNAAGNSVACSEFAKGHAKKAVLGSLLVIGALGMATTASAQAQSSSIGTLEEIEKKAQKLAEQAGTGKITDDEMVKKLLALSIQGNQISIQDLNIRSDINKDRIAENKKKIQMNDDYIGDLYEANNENVERLIEHGDKIWANEESVQYLNKEVQNNINNIQNLSKASSANTKRIATAEMGIAENKKDALIAKAQANKNKADIQDLAKAQLAGVTVFEELNKNIEENKRDLSAVTGKVFKNQIDIQKNNESIEDLYEYGQQVADSIKDIHDHNKAQNDTIQDLITNSTKNTDNIAKNKADVDAKFKGVQTDIANNKTTLAQHANQINENKQAIEAKLGGKVDVQKLAELKTNVDKNQADADAKFKGVQTDIANNKTTLAQHANQINENKQAIEAKLGGKVDTQKLAELKTSVDKNQADADAKFTATEVAIAKNTQSITTLDSKVNTFDGRISALDAKVNGFDGRINALDDKFKNGMAAQAALNGLFQPYSVGKVSVSAAIGGYGSKSAIAIGAGYRVNPQLAFKGGTAINMGGSKKGSYNIGVNYEF